MGAFFESIAEWFSNQGQRYYDAFIGADRYKAYLSGLKVTLEISFFAIILGVIIGVIVAIVKVTAANKKGLKWAGVLCSAYINIIRGTPVILQLLIISNMIFTARDANPVVTGVVCFGINSGAYVAEIFRAGIESIDKGQMEAGRSLGFNYLQTMRYIILPQAIKNVLPTLANEFIVLIKETSVAGYIALTDLTKAAQFVGSRTYDVLPPLFIAAIVYLIIVLGLTRIIRLFERRMAQNDTN